jgi:hypothetical protein
VWCEEQQYRNDNIWNYAPPYKEVWDQKVLQDILPRITDLRIFELPYEYAKITRTPSGEELMPGIVDPVIEQHQASRRNKRKV